MVTANQNARGMTVLSLNVHSLLLNEFCVMCQQCGVRRRRRGSSNTRTSNNVNSLLFECTTIGRRMLPSNQHVQTLPLPAKIQTAISIVYDPDSPG